LASATALQKYRRGPVTFDEPWLQSLQTGLTEPWHLHANFLGNRSLPKKVWPMSTRECGTCSLCCKVLDVPAVYKPAGKWCKHCEPGKGCATYKLRPKACRDFNCLWLSSDTFGPEWKPEVSKFVMSIDEKANCLMIHPDQKLPGAWTAEPYYSFIKRMSESFLARDQVILVDDGSNILLVLPDQDVKIGPSRNKYAWTITPKVIGTNTTYDVQFRVAA
jgi:hypothetical protein